MPKVCPVSYKTLCRVLEAEGFRLARQEGDHRRFARATEKAIQDSLRNLWNRLAEFAAEDFAE